MTKTATQTSTTSQRTTFQVGSDWLFLTSLSILGGSYVLLIVLLIVADLLFTSPTHFLAVLGRPEIQASIRLTLISCTLSALMSIWVATPLGYLLSRFKFRGRWLIETLVDIPIVLPPLVIGLSLLILFHLPWAGTRLEDWLQTNLGWQLTFAAPAVVLAQFTVACASRRTSCNHTRCTTQPSLYASRASASWPWHHRCFYDCLGTFVG
jgi:molybdate transport system permease protein